MNKEERMETTPQNKKGPDTHSTADRAATAKKTREEAARKLKAAIKEAAKAADTGAGSGSATRNTAAELPPILPTPPPNRGVSLLGSTEGAVSDAHPLPSPSGRYNSIMINRDIKYSQSVLGGGTYSGLKLECGNFYSLEDFRIHRATVHEDMSSSIVKSTSFEKENFVCLSCNSGHKLLPRKRNKGQWEGGRKLIVLSDQNFGPVLKMSENNCPVIIRVEGGWLSEIGDALVASLGDNFTGHHVPEGSVVLLGSLSDLMSQGPQGHAKSLCAEVRRLNGLFHNTVTVVPFVPIPLYGTNSSSLVMGMVDITEWLDSVQKPPLSGYNSAVRSYILSSVWEGGRVRQVGPL